MKNNNDSKMALYTFVVAFACVLLKKIIAPSIPTTFSLAIAAVLLFMGLVLTVIEIKNNLDFFYGFSTNWNGYGIVNSGFVIGIANYFLSSNFMYGILSGLLLAVIVWIIRLGMRSVFSKNAKL
ncbi:MAG: hypothetical protein Q4D77_02500 [Peptostreptococcaceae bacterium]|nr:hypothetical protein [Peptostreptococcaceae bacterium]